MYPIYKKIVLAQTLLMKVSGNQKLT